MSHDPELAALRSNSVAWWDDGFTRLLTELVSAEAREIVEIGCGVARAAHSLLPSLPDARYTGFTADPADVERARQALAGTRFEKRVTIEVNDGPLPLGDASCDVVLSVLSLQRTPTVDAVLADARRVLRQGGRLVAVEPDNLGQRFYFDGVLEEINDVFHRLFLRARVASQPADIAIGPRLPPLLTQAGFLKVSMIPYAVHSTRAETAKAFFGRLKRIGQLAADEAGLLPDCPELAACEQAINRGLFAGIPKRVGYSSHLVPVFCCLAHTQ